MLNEWGNMQLRGFGILASKAQLTSFLRCLVILLEMAKASRVTKS